MKARDFLARVARRGYRVLAKPVFLNPECLADRQLSNDMIFDLISAGKPAMISRFGTVEINCINNYLCVESSNSCLVKLYRYIVGNTHTPWWNESHFVEMQTAAGIFPPDIKTARRFSQRYLEDIPEIDLLGCHQYYERYMPLRDDVRRVQLEMLYPFKVDKPWTSALLGKRVLVIHPFAGSIASQFGKREALFDNANVLPDFDLLTLRAVQSAAGADSGFADWFAALEFMELQVSNLDFDVAIIGCGAYGLPLAATVKRLGKIAVHLGGGTQLLFGIKGRRWLEDYKGVWNYRPNVSIDIDYSGMFNDHWVFPGETERPIHADKVERACYW